MLSDPFVEQIKIAYQLIEQGSSVFGSVRKRFQAFETVKDFVEDSELGPAITRAKDELLSAVQTLEAHLEKLP